MMAEMTERKVMLAQAIAECVGAYRRCVESGNKEWEEKHYERLESLCAHLPHGAGIDSTVPDNLTGLDLDASSEMRIVVNLSFHHMNDGGMYDGWTEHTVTVTPTFGGVWVRVSGRNRNGIKDYLAETYHGTMSELVKEY